MKFSWKVTLATLCILVTSFGIGGYLLVSLSFRSALDREVTAAQEEMQLLRVSFEALCAAKGMTLDNLDTVGRRVTRTLKEDAIFQDHQFLIRTQSGRTFYSSLSGSGDRELLSAVNAHSFGYILRRTEKTGGVHIHCAGTIPLGGGALYLESVRDISGLFVDRETQYRVFRWLLLAVAGVSGALLYLFSTWLTRPIRDLERVTTALSGGDYSTRASVQGNDEVGSLALHFNRMADAIEKNVQELEDARQRQEEFTACFVHELKTPLTSIIGYADMLRSRTLSEEQRFRAASYIFEQGKRLENLSLSLMNLLVVGHTPAEFKTVSMRTLIDRTVRTARPAMEKRGVRLLCRAEACELPGDGALLQTLLLNLLDNARKASAPGGAVVLEGSRTPDGYRLAVTDQGRGIPQEELAKITEAFYMVDKSRSRAEGGAGLGLALCKKIAALHGSSLRFISKEGVGTRVLVELRVQNKGGIESA